MSAPGENAFHPALTRAPAGRDGRGRDRATWDRVALGLGVLAALALLAGLQLTENVNSDSARYIGLADALHERGRYEFNFQPHTRFAPGFPLLLAGVRSVLGSGYLDTLRAVALLSVLALWAGYGLLRAEGRPGVGCAALVLLAGSPYFFARATRTVAPEAAYMLASFAALYTMARLARRPPASLAARVGLSAALAAAVVAAIALRSVGVALLVPLALALVAPGRRGRAGGRAAALAPALAAGAAFELGWLVWERVHRVETWPGEFMHSYTAQLVLRDPHQPELGSATLTSVLQRVFENLAAQAAAFSELASHLPFVDHLWFSPWVALPALLGAVGLWRRLRSQRPPLLELYTLAYLAIVLLWPFDEGPRFLLVVFPLALLYVVEGAEGLWLDAVRSPSRARRLAGAASAALAAGALVHLARAGGTPGRQTLASAAFWGLGALASLALGRVAPGRIAPDRHLHLAGRAGLALGLGVSLALGAVQISALFRENRSGSRAALSHPETVDAAAWLAAEAAPGERVMAGQEAVVHYLTGLRAIPFPVSSDPKLLHDVLAAFEVRYWIVLEDEPHPYFRPTERERLERFDAAYPGAARIVRRGPNYRILALDRPAPSAERRESAGASTAVRPARLGAPLPGGRGEGARVVGTLPTLEAADAAVAMVETRGCSHGGHATQAAGRDGSAAPHAGGGSR